MKLSELENIILRPASNLMKIEGEKAFKEGLIFDIKGKKIEGFYHIYGRANDERKTTEFNTHIKVNMVRKKLDSVKCSCEDFKELSSEGYMFMCSHLTGTAYKFLSLALKKDKSEAKKEEIKPKAKEERKELRRDARLIRKVTEESTYYLGNNGLEKENFTLKPEQLRDFLCSIKNNKVKFKYEHLEFTAPIFHKNLPLVFTLKEREGHLVLTTQKQLPIPLSSRNDVYFFKNELYLPSKEQIDKYLPLYERLKSKGEVLYKKDIINYSRIMETLSSITSDIIVGEEVKSFAATLMRPKFFIYEERDIIYCDVKIGYGDRDINILKDSNDKEKYIRDYKKEDRIIMELEKYGFEKRNHRFIFVGGEDALFDILSKRGNIHSLGTVIYGKGIKDMQIYNSSSIEAIVSEDNDFFKLSYKIGEVESRELNSMLNAFRNNNRFYKTKDKSYIDFEDNGVRDFLSLLEILSIDNDLQDGYAEIEKNRALYLNESIKNKDIHFIRGVEAFKELENKLLNIDNMDVTLPKNLRGKLRDYQVNGYKWLKGLGSLGFGGILADEMGLGKTIQTITFLLSEADKKTIIICPTSLIYNWMDEFERFAPSVRVAVVHGEKSGRNKLIEKFSDYDVILTTYGTLRMDIEAYKNIIFDYCIIDEGQNIKNALAQSTKVIKELKAKGRFALTGTPIENNLTELWSIFDFIMPGYLYSQQVFNDRFIVKKEENIGNLKLLINPFLLRRTKKEVMKELPDKIEKKFLVEMTSAQKAVYNTYAKFVRDKVNASSDNKIEVFSYLTRLRQVCLDPSIIVDEYAGGSGKLKVAMDLIKDHIEEEGKLLLFSQFTSVLKNIGQRLEEEGIEYFQLDGSTKPKDRINMVKEFNSNDNIKVFLISLKAGGTGLNLTSANLVIHFDPWWNPAVEDQATDRAHRIGQRNVVEVIKLVAKGTIEEKIVLLQEGKKDLINSVITGELKNSSSLSKLSKEELLQLFSRD